MFNLNIIKENIRSKAINSSTEVISDIKRHVVTTVEVSKNVADQTIFYGEHDHADRFLSGLMAKYPYINAIHVNLDPEVPNLDYHNIFAFRQKDSIEISVANEPFPTCAASQNIFDEISADKTPGWSRPIRCRKSNNIIVTYYTPVKITDNDNTTKIVGEVFCEMSLLELNRSINNISIGKNGIASLVDKDGNFITHPKEEWILERNIFEISDRIYDPEKTNMKENLKKGITGSIIAYPEIMDFEKAWVYFTPIENTDWILLFVLPYKEFYEPLYLPILRMLFFSVLGILIIYLLVTYISNKQIQPLSNVTTQLKKFSSLTGNPEIDTLNEVQHVSESLNFIRAWYEKYKANRSKEIEKNRLRREDLLQAAEIQRSFIKSTFPAFPGRTDIDLYAVYKPARTVSGDFYDYFFIDDENLVLTIGDVSGKGIPAAIFMSIAQTVIKKAASVSKKKKARTIVKNASAELYTNNQHQFFITLFLGILNVKTGKLTYCNAAHTPTYILKKNGKIQQLKEAHGLPLGLHPEKKYNENSITLEKGDSIILYTDGVTEMQDKNRVIYGRARFEENIKSLKNQTPKEMVERITKSLDMYRGNTTQSDDISILVVKYNA